jgi:hypothetical protein
MSNNSIEAEAKPVIDADFAGSVPGDNNGDSPEPLVPGWLVDSVGDPDDDDIDDARRNLFYDTLLQVYVFFGFYAFILTIRDLDNFEANC